MWLKAHNPAYSDIIISNERLDALPVDEEIDVTSVHYQENASHMNDKGPAPDQTEAFLENIDEETVSSVLLPDPAVNIQD